MPAPRLFEDDFGGPPFKDPPRYVRRRVRVTDSSRATFERWRKVFPLPANLLGMSGDQCKCGIRNEWNLGMHDTDEFNVCVARPMPIRQTLDDSRA